MIRHKRVAAEGQKPVATSLKQGELAFTPDRRLYTKAADNTIREVAGERWATRIIGAEDVFQDAGGIQHQRLSTIDGKPTSVDENGLVVNISDGSLWSKGSDGVIYEINSGEPPPGVKPPTEPSHYMTQGNDATIAGYLTGYVGSLNPTRWNGYFIGGLYAFVTGDANTTLAFGSGADNPPVVSFKLTWWDGEDEKVTIFRESNPGNQSYTVPDITQRNELRAYLIKTRGQTNIPFAIEENTLFEENSMVSGIRYKASNTAGFVPTELEIGEFFINHADKWLFTKREDDTIISLGSSRADVSKPYVFTIDTRLMGSQYFIFNFEKPQNEKVVVDWGTGDTDEYGAGTDVRAIYEYNRDVYKISIHGNITHVRLGVDSNSRRAVISVDSWGDKMFSNTNTAASYGMFYSCTNLRTIPSGYVGFTGVISNMFSRCESLTSVVLSEFDVKNVTNMNDMFSYCVSLTDVDVSNLDTSNVTSMNAMFYNTGSVKVDVSNFKVNSLLTAEIFSANSTIMDVSTYDRTLENWSTQVVNSGVRIDFGGCKYTNVTARQALISKGWTIADGGPA